MKLIFIFVFISMGLSADAAPKKHHRGKNLNQPSKCNKVASDVYQLTD